MLVYNLRLTHLVCCSLVVIAKKKLLAANVDTIIHSHPETKDQCMCYTRFGSTDCTNHKKTSKKQKAGSTSYAKDCGKIVANTVIFS